MHLDSCPIKLYCQQNLYQGWWTGPACVPQGPIGWTGTGERHMSGIVTMRLPTGERDTIDPLSREPDPLVYLSHSLWFVHSVSYGSERDVRKVHCITVFINQALAFWKFHVK